MESSSNDYLRARPYCIYVIMIVWAFLTIEVVCAGIMYSHLHDQNGIDATARITGKHVSTYPMPIARDFSFHAYFLTYIFRTDDSQTHQCSTEVKRTLESYSSIGGSLPIRYHPDDPANNSIMIPCETEYHDVIPVGYYMLGVLQAVLGVVCLLVYFSKHPRAMLIFLWNGVFIAAVILGLIICP